MHENIIYDLNTKSLWIMLIHELTNGGGKLKCFSPHQHAVCKNILLQRYSPAKFPANLTFKIQIIQKMSSMSPTLMSHQAHTKEITKISLNQVIDSREESNNSKTITSGSGLIDSRYSLSVPFYLYHLIQIPVQVINLRRMSH